MLGGDGEVLYVGKARSIRKRVLAYTTPERQTIRIARMIAQTVSMVFVTTETEAEALLLEANLIKQLKPRYNVLLRDDKSFPYILITGGHEAPQLVKHRGARTGKGDYFGPFASATAVLRTLNAYAARVPAAHLLGQLSTRTARGPACYSRSSAARRPARARSRSRTIANWSARRAISWPAAAARSDSGSRSEMTEAAEALEFEKAARLRDRISALSAIQGEQSVNPRSVPEADVFAIVRGSGPVLHRGVLLPHLSELGQPRLFPARRPRAERGRGAGRLPRAILSRSAGAAAGAAEPRRAQRRDAVRNPERARRAIASRSACPSAARRRSWSRTRCATRARRFRANWRRRRARKSCSARWAPPSAWRRRAAARRGLRQFAHHGHECDRRDDRRGARRLRQEPVPHLQHQERRR